MKNHIPALVVGRETCGRCVYLQTDTQNMRIEKEALKNRISVYDANPPTADDIRTAVYRMERDVMVEAVQRMEAGEFTEGRQAIQCICDELCCILSLSGSAGAKRQINELRDIESMLCRPVSAETASDIDSDCVLVCDRLSTEAALLAMRNRCRGMITAQYNPASHAYLLLLGAGITIAKLSEGEPATFSGKYAALRPVEQCIDVFSRPQDMGGLELYGAIPQETEDHSCIRLSDGSLFLLNYSIAGSLERIPAGARIGLYRTEFFRCDEGVCDFEAALTEEFATVAALSSEVTLRLPDFGADKPLPNTLHSYEGALNDGNRGVRFLLACPQLLRMYLRAALRVANSTKLRILVPMIRNAEELKQVRVQMLSCAEELNMPGHVCAGIPLGAMVETKEAMANIAAIANEADFISVGTNDLSADIAGADRFSMNGYPTLNRQTWLEVLHDAAQPFISRGKRACLCGELACNIEGIRILLHAGIREASVPISDHARIAGILMGEML